MKYIYLLPALIWRIRCNKILMKRLASSPCCWDTTRPMEANGQPMMKNPRTWRIIPLICGPFTIPSMYGIFTYIWLIFMVNVGKYITHGCYGLEGVFNNPIGQGDHNPITMAMKHLQVRPGMILQVVPGKNGCSLLSNMVCSREIRVRFEVCF